MGTNIVNLPDGTVHQFPANATPQQMQDALSAGLNKFSAPVKQSGPNTFDPALNKTIDFIRPFVGQGVGALAAIPGAAIGGPVGAFVGETQGYAGIDSLLQQLKTDKEKPSFGEGLENSEKDALINSVGGRIMSGLFRGGGAVLNMIKGAEQPEVYNHLPTTSQALESFGYHKLATLPKFAEDFGAGGAKSDALDRAGGAGFSQALKFANAINGRTFNINSDPVKLADKIRGTLEDGLEPTSKYYGGGSKQFVDAANNPTLTPTQEAVSILKGGQTPFAKIDAVLQDPDRLSKVLVAGQAAGQSGQNVRKDLQAYQFMKIMNDSTTKGLDGSVRIDPNKISSIWNDPDKNTVFQTLYGTEGRKNITDFFQKVAVTQDKQNSYPVAKAVRLLDGGVGLAGGLLTGHVSLGAAGGTLGTLFVPSAVLGNLLTKPTTARILTAMAGSEPLGQSSQLAARVLTDGLQGASVAIMGSDDKKTWGTFKKDKDGNVTFVENSTTPQK